MRRSCARRSVSRRVAHPVAHGIDRSPRSSPPAIARADPIQVKLPEDVLYQTSRQVRMFRRRQESRWRGPLEQRWIGFNGEKKRGCRALFPTAPHAVGRVSSRRGGAACRPIVFDDVDYLVDQPLAVFLLQHDEGGVAFDRPHTTDPSAFQLTNLAALTDIR